MFLLNNIFSFLSLLIKSSNFETVRVCFDFEAFLYFLKNDWIFLAARYFCCLCINFAIIHLAFLSLIPAKTSFHFVIR